MRRTVTTLLVVASPLLTAVPVGAYDPGPAGPLSLPAAPAVVRAPAVPAVAAPVVAAPAAPAVKSRRAAVTAAPAVARPAVKAVRPRAAPRPASANDAAYAARLQAELCRARQIFCGLDHGGRYPAR